MELDGGAKANERFGARAEAVGGSGAESAVISADPGTVESCSLPVYYTNPGLVTSTTSWEQVPLDC